MRYLFILIFSLVSFEARTAAASTPPDAAVPSASLPALRSFVLAKIQNGGLTCSRPNLSFLVVDAEIRRAQRAMVRRSPNQPTIVFIYRPSEPQPPLTGSQKSVGLIFRPDGQTLREIILTSFDPAGPFLAKNGRRQVSPGLIIRSIESCVPASPRQGAGSALGIPTAPTPAL